jgi:hypothetical protein
VGCTGSRIQAIGNRIQLFVTIDGQVRAFWQVLKQQVGGMFANAALPRTRRVAKVDTYVPIAARRLSVSFRCPGYRSGSGAEAH